MSPSEYLEKTHKDKDRIKTQACPFSREMIALPATWKASSLLTLLPAITAASFKLSSGPHFTPPSHLSAALFPYIPEETPTYDSQGSLSVENPILSASIPQQLCLPFRDFRCVTVFVGVELPNCRHRFRKYQNPQIYVSTCLKVSVLSRKLSAQVPPNAFAIPLEIKSVTLANICSTCRSKAVAGEGGQGGSPLWKIICMGAENHKGDHSVRKKFWGLCPHGNFPATALCRSLH